MSCEQTFPYKWYYHFSLIPACFILIVLTCYRYYKTNKWSLVLPFKYLSERNSDRMRYVLAFGSFASVISDQLVSKKLLSVDVTLSWVFTPFLTIVLAAELGFMYYPIFSCIYTKYVSLGRGLGFCYVLFHFVQKIATVSMWTCKPTIGQVADLILPKVPELICTFILLLLLIKDFMISLCYSNSTENKHEKHCVLDEENATYVQGIFRNEKKQVYTSFYEKFRWRNNPMFKYSTLLLSMSLIINVFFFQLFVQFSIAIQGLDSLAILSLAITLLGFIVYSAQLLRFIVCHRANMLQMYKGGKYCEKVKHRSPDNIIMSCLSFVGFLVGLTITGAVLYSSLFTLIGTILIPLIEDDKVDFGLLFKKGYAFVVIPLVSYVLQRATTYFVFTEPGENHNNATSSTWIHHLGIYHISLYFFFFGNLLVGLFSCLFTTVLGFIINLSSLGRLDISVFNPEYYLFVDRGHKSYLSFLQIESRFKNPSMRCFCQILLEQRDERFVHTKPILFARLSTRALNRWHLAVMLIRNRSLIKHRRQNGLTHERKTYGSYDEMKTIP